MRYAFALYDAPMPALAALRGLARAGFAPADVAVLATDVPAEARGLAGDRILPRDLGPEPWAPVDGALAMDEAAIVRALEARGLAPDDAATCAMGVARQRAHLVVVCCPTLSAPLAQAALDVAMPPPLAVHRARWAGAGTASVLRPA